MIQVKKNEMKNQATTCNGTSLVDPVLKREWRVSREREWRVNQSRKRVESESVEKESGKQVRPSILVICEREGKENHKLVREKERRTTSW